LVYVDSMLYLHPERKERCVYYNTLKDKNYLVQYGDQKAVSEILSTRGLMLRVWQTCPLQSGL